MHPSAQRLTLVLFEPGSGSLQYVAAGGLGLATLLEGHPDRHPLTLPVVDDVSAWSA